MPIVWAAVVNDNPRLGATDRPDGIEHRFHGHGRDRMIHSWMKCGPRDLTLDVRWLARDLECVATVSREPPKRHVLPVVSVFGSEEPDFLVREKMMVAQVTTVGN